MGLLMSDTVLIDPLLNETLRLRDGLIEWAYEADAAHDSYEHEAVAPTDDPTAWQWLRIWPHHQVAQV